MIVYRATFTECHSDCPPTYRRPDPKRPNDGCSGMSGVGTKKTISQPNTDVFTGPQAAERSAAVRWNAMFGGMGHVATHSVA